MDRLTSLRVFVEIVEAGSFAAAARRLGVSAPMASKHVAELEQATGARLLNRSSRRLSATEAGEAYYAQCRQALEILDAADEEVSQHSTTPRGLLKVSAPVWCANRHFAAGLAEYRRRYPNVVVDLRLENRMVDLVAEGFDLALRATPEPSPTLFARKICDVRLHVVATPEFLARNHARNTLANKQTIEVIAPSYIDANKMFASRWTKNPNLTPEIVMRTNDSNLIHLSALSGVGAAVLPDWIAADDIAAGRFVALTLNRPPPNPALHAVYASRRHVPLKLRSFIDFFSRHLSASGAR
jgi:DNA-binding transcriptional LysR family regulator